MFLSCWWRIWVCLTMGWIFAVFHGFGGTIFSVRPIFLIFLVETLRASLFSFLIKSRHCASSPWRLSWRFNPQSWFHPHPPVIKHGSKIMKPWCFPIQTSNLSRFFSLKPPICRWFSHSQRVKETRFGAIAIKRSSRSMSPRAGGLGSPERFLLIGQELYYLDVWELWTKPWESVFKYDEIG